MRKTYSEVSSQQVNKYQQIYLSALKLLYPHTPERTYSTIVQEAMKLVSAKYGSLFLFVDDQIKRVYSSDEILYQTVPRTKGHTWRTYKTQKPYYLDIGKIKNLHPEIERLNISTDIGIPLCYNDKAFGVISVMADSEKPFIEEDLVTLMLFSPLASLALRNTQLYSDIIDSLQEQDLFISMAAHELKTPLTSISIYAQLLIQEDIKSHKPATEFKIKMYNEIQRLSKLVNELLQVSQIKKGRLQYTMKKHNIVEIIANAVANFQTGDQTHRYFFVSKLKNEKIYIKCDADKITQIITNLLNNASKYSPVDTKVKVMIIEESDEVKITVKDSGAGITEKDLPRIFEGFYKPNLAKKEGLGLGLFLVKNIVEKHKGKITVTSKIGKGTTFTIMLPQYIETPRPYERRI